MNREEGDGESDEEATDRCEDPSDRRAYTVRLTAEGKRQFRAMARAHEGWIVELFGGLDGKQQAALFELLGELKQSLPPASLSS